MLGLADGVEEEAEELEEQMEEEEEQTEEGEMEIPWARPIDKSAAHAVSLAPVGPSIAQLLPGIVGAARSRQRLKQRCTNVPEGSSYGRGVDLDSLIMSK
jgi:hypothetical protein